MELFPPYEQGDLVSYATRTRGPVKGVVIDTYPDPVYHLMVVVKVTSLNHQLYQKNMELAVAYDDPDLKLRKSKWAKRSR